MSQKDATSKKESNKTRSPARTESLYYGVRGTAVKILSRVDRSDSYLEKLVDNAIRNEGFDRRDAGLLKEITHGVLRHRERLDWVLNGFYHGEFARALPPIKNALRIALYQILFLDRIPWSAAVNESVNLVKRLKGERSAGVVNGVLRNVIRRIDSITWPEEDPVPLHYLSIMGSHPKWMVRRWIDRFGAEETEALLKANLERPPVTLHVLSNGPTPQEVADRLHEAEIECTFSPLLPNYLRVPRLPGIAELDLIRNGEVVVQDDAAGLAALLTGVKPGMSVIDLCAAPGGKSIAMAEQMGRTGSITALDRFDAKVEALRDAVERLGLQDIVTTAVGDARTFEHEPVDLVLLDAPCTGIGVLRRKPEIKWKREMKDLRELVAIQRDLISAAARLVRPGGSLVYSTCSTEPEENQDIVAWFLENHPEFTLIPATGFLPSEALSQGVVDESGFLQTFPHRHGTDGAFGAHLKRRT